MGMKRNFKYLLHRLGIKFLPMQVIPKPEKQDNIPTNIWKFYKNLTIFGDSEITANINININNI